MQTSQPTQPEVAQSAGAYGASYTQPAGAAQLPEPAPGSQTVQPANVGAPTPLQNQSPQQQQQIQLQPIQQQQQNASAYNLQQGQLQTAQPLPLAQDAASQPPPGPPPKRGFFSIFRRKGEMPPPTGQPYLYQQSAQQAFPGPPGAPVGQPINPAQHSFEPPLPRDAQPLQELVGGNWIFVIFIPYFVATALQDTHLQIGLIAASGTAGGVIVLGFMFWLLNLRKVFPHILEIMMLITLVIPLGVSYKSEAYKTEIIRTFPFIINSSLAGTCLASLLVCYPVGYQAAQELVHRMYMTHSEVHRCGMYTTAFLTASLVTSDLLYLVPLTRGKDTRHWNALNLIFRIIYPCVATFLALLFVRFFPSVYLPNMAVVHGLNRKPPARMPAYLANAQAQAQAQASAAANLPKPPTILDATMYQSTVDAAAKQREAATMRPAPQAMTPRYGAGGKAGEFSQLPMDLAAPMPGALVPGGVRTEGGHALYTYYAAGPPNPPPLAVYAVYGDYDAPLARGPLPGGGLSPPPLWDAQEQMAQMGGNPLRAGPQRGVQPLLYGGPSRVAPYGGRNRMYGPGMYDDDPRRQMYGPYDQYDPYDRFDRYEPRARMYGGGPPGMYPRRNYATVGGAGPYGVNMPLGAMAAGDAGFVQGPMGYRQPDAIVTNRRYFNPDMDPDMDPDAGGYGFGGPPYGDGPYGGYGGGGGRYGGQPWQRRALGMGPGRMEPPPPAVRDQRGSTWDVRGRVSVRPGAMGMQPDGVVQRHGGYPEGGGYGLNADVRQARLQPQMQPAMRPPAAQYGNAPRTYGLEAEQTGLRSPQRAGYGLDAEVSGPQYGGLRSGAQYGTPLPATNPVITPRVGNGAAGFGLDAETNIGGGGGGGMYGNRPRMSPEASGYGLDAEVGGPTTITPPYSPGLGAPMPLGPPRPVLARAPAGGGGYGLDAEVG